jgi:hypothetical protein
VKALEGKQIVQLAASKYHTLAVLDNGQLWSWLPINIINRFLIFLGDLDLEVDLDMEEKIANYIHKELCII